VSLPPYPDIFYLIRVFDQMIFNGSGSFETAAPATPIVFSPGLCPPDADMIPLNFYKHPIPLFQAKLFSNIFWQNNLTFG
jgi:hypothetical protein